MVQDSPRVGNRKRSTARDTTCPGGGGRKARYPVLSWRGCTQSCSGWGYPSLSSGEGVPQSCPAAEGEGCPGPVLAGGTPVLFCQGDVSFLSWQGGTPVLPHTGVPHFPPGNCGTHHLGMGYPSLGLGTPPHPLRLGYPPPGTEVPSPAWDWGTPPPQRTWEQLKYYGMEMGYPSPGVN